VTIDPVLTWSFLGVGLFGQGFAWMLARRPIRLLRAGGRTQGTVTGSDEETIAGGRGAARAYHFPQIAFTTARGERIVFKSPSGGRIPVAPGTSLPVIFDPASPHDAIVAGFRSLWLFPLATSLMSLPFLAVGILGVLG
jgi:hypothetical protein